MRTFGPFLGLALLGLVAAGPAPEKGKLHERMTAEEVKKTFNTEPHEVPEYDVVSIQWPRIHKRSYGASTRVRLNAFGRDINLWLNPTDGTLVGQNTPVYFARYDPGSDGYVLFSELNSPMSVVAEILEDREKQATMIVKRSADGRTTVSGLIGSEGWTVKPVPQRLDNHLRSRTPSSDDQFQNFTLAGDYEPVYHFIYKNPEVPENVDYITKPLSDDVLNNLESRSKRSAPSTIYPEILVFVDYDTYTRYDGLWELLEYLVPFWNGVDLRYRGLEFPKVRLNIAGIIIATDPNAFPFVAENKVEVDALNIVGTLKSFSKFLRKVESRFPLDSYDVAVIMGSAAMCAPTGFGMCQKGVLGLAYISGACNQIETPEPRSLAASVIQDKGGFDGMHTAAHELGHLFGANHDGQGTSLCSGAEGHIMATTPVLSEHSSDWSPCSLQDFDNFFNHKNPQCLFNKPKTTSSLPRILPGRILSLDDQCKKIEGTKACAAKEHICRRLRCISSEDSDYCTEVGAAAADGSRCAEGKICIHGECLAEADIV